MHVTHVIHSLNPIQGGTSVAVRSLAENCHAHGIPSRVICLDPPDGIWLQNWTCPVIGTGPTRSYFGWTPRFKPAVEAVLPETDLLVIHGLWQFHGVAAASACRAARIPYVIYPHGMLDPWALAQSPLKRAMKSAMWHLYMKAQIRDAEAICFTCDEERSAAFAGRLPRPTPTEITPLGVSGPPDNVETLQKEFWDLQPSIPRERKILLFLGRLHPKKGCNMLLEAFGKLRRAGELSQVHLRLTGPAESEEYLAELLAICERMGLKLNEDVSFPGMAKDRQKWRELAASAALILPSFQENFGLVVGEALACGRPALLSDKVNIWRTVTEGQAGLAKPATAEGVTALLTEWASWPEEEQKKRSLQAEALFHKEFSLPNMVEHFHRMAAKHARPAS